MSWRDMASKAVSKAKHAALQASKTAKTIKDKGSKEAQAIAEKAEKEAHAATGQLEDMFDYIEEKTGSAAVAQEKVDAQLIDYARQVIKGNEKAFKALHRAAARASVRSVKEELFVPLLKGSSDVSERDAADMTSRTWSAIVGGGGVPQDEWQWRDWLPHSLSIGLAAGGASWVGMSGSGYFAFGSDRYVPYYHLALAGTAGFEFEGFVVLQLGLWRATNGQAYGSFIGAEGAFYAEFGGGLGVYFDPRILVKIVTSLARIDPVNLLPEYDRAWQDFLQGGLAMGGIGAGLNVDVTIGYARRSIPRIIYEGV